jgi:peptide/nickel transport system permease protein
VGRSARFAARRLGWAVPLVLAVVTVDFALVHLAPGDPVTYLVGDPTLVTAEQLDQVRQDLQLDQPLWRQFLAYLGALLRGDLGFSILNRRPVLALILERLPATLLLMAASLVLSLLAGLLLGFVSALKARSVTDYALGLLSLLGYSMPPFWFGLVLILVFALSLEWFPTMGMTTLGRDLGFWPSVGDVLYHLALPAATLATYYTAIYARVARTSLLGVLGQPFLVTARAKGLGWLAVYLKHAARNALIPLVTFFGLQIGVLFTGSILTEIVFAWPGLGMLTVNALLQRDYPLILGILMSSVCVVLGNLVADLLYGVVDPRIRG